MARVRVLPVVAGSSSPSMTCFLGSTRTWPGVQGSRGMMQMASCHSLIRVEGISPRRTLQKTQVSIAEMADLLAILASADGDARSAEDEEAGEGSGWVVLVCVDGLKDVEELALFARFVEGGGLVVLVGFDELGVLRLVAGFVPLAIGLPEEVGCLRSTWTLST